MFIGLCFAVAACVVWGLIFVIPVLLSDFQLLEVVFGRYFTYGLFSCLLLFRRGFTPLKILTPRVWGTALLLAFFANPLYYICTITGIRFASPPLAILFLGVAPIVIVVYGNWHVREISLKHLTLPFIAILVGLLCVNATDLLGLICIEGDRIDLTCNERGLVDYLIGFLGIFIALLAWTGYVVHNARFLKRNPQIPTSEWATVLGVATFVWVIILSLLGQYGFEVFDFKHLFAPSPTIIRYWVGSATLGLVCSWVGCFLWNRASTLLPVSLMGPLTIFETLFGLIYVYIFEGTLPPLLEIAGAILMIGGVALAIKSFQQNSLTHS